MVQLTSDSTGNPPVTWSAAGDTVRMPWTAEGGITDTVVRPALAVLFRMAVGTGADFYVPHLLRRESHSRAAPGWVWPAFFCPAGWAFYRKLWWSGTAFALLPVVGLAAFLAAGEFLGDSEVVWWAALLSAVAIVPGIAAALLAIPLLHRQVRRRVRQAEAMGERADRVATLLAGRQPTSLLHGVLLGFAALAMWLAVALPVLQGQRDDRAVRARVVTSLAVVAPLRQAIADSRAQSVPVSRLLTQATLAPDALGAAGLEVVVVDPANGRLRLTFAAAVAALAGKSLVLAPVIDPDQRLRWLCVPIDIPARLLPPECRRR